MILVNRNKEYMPFYTPVPYYGLESEPEDDVVLNHVWEVLFGNLDTAHEDLHNFMRYKHFITKQQALKK